MVLVALAMVAIIAMAALSIDVITLYLAREEAQRSADAAALAAARVISLSGMTGDPSNHLVVMAGDLRRVDEPCLSGGHSGGDAKCSRRHRRTASHVTYSAGGGAQPNCSDRELLVRSA